MDNKKPIAPDMPYGVMVRSQIGEVVNRVPLAHLPTLEDACSVALGYFRNSNVPKVEVCVYKRNSKAVDPEIVRFSHE